ncbi:MAG: FkbM family methyltransferase [Terriglobales bacterium]
MPVLQGPLRGTRWIVGASNHGCWLGSYEYGKQRAFQEVVRQGSVVYDIGANVGFYTLLASKLVGRSGQVYAFEPAPRNCRLLQRHLEMNGVDNVSVVQMAVFSTNGEALFDSSANHSMGHLAACGTLKVPTIAIDRFVFDQAMPAPEVIKIDVEGAELEVLKGSYQTLCRHRPLILLATHGAAVHRECCRILEEHGFVLESLDARPVEQSDELLARPSGDLMVNQGED